ncbi:MAG: LamG-like jellyroll fold domain-containing protein [Sedimentisphaeraceae bacterium JB056]
MSKAKRYTCLCILLISTCVCYSERPTSPFKVLYSNDTTNIYSCISPYQTVASPFNSEKLRASVDETVGTGVEVHMLQPGVCWVPWWKSTVYPAPDHYFWFMNTYQVNPDSFGMYMINDGDVVQVFVDRCREKGLTPFISFRLNDGHRLDNVNDLPGQIPSGACNNITPFYKNNPDYRIGDNLDSWYERVQNWAIPAVREYKLASIEEICENYDIDGLELDFMRMCSFFDTSATTSFERANIMTSVIADVRGYLDDNTAEGDYKWLCVRVPCYISTHDALGIDLPSMVAAGVDMVNLSSYFFTDQQAEIAEIKALIPDTAVYYEMTGTPLTGNPVPGVYDSYDYLRTTAEQFYTSAHIAYNEGASGVSLFNFQYYRDHGEDIGAPFTEPPFEIMEHLGEPQWLASQNHYHFIGGIWNSPPISNRPLNRVFSAGSSYTFTMPLYPQLYGQSKLRIRADASIADSSWTAKINGYQLSPTGDVSEIYDNTYPNFKGEEEDYKAWIVPIEYLESGDNDIYIKLDSGESARIIWIDLMTPNWSANPVFEMNADNAGSQTETYWKPVTGSGTGDLTGIPEITAENAADNKAVWFYRFDSTTENNDQVVNVDPDNLIGMGSDACTIEVWLRQNQQINNSKLTGMVIGNIDSLDNGWRFDVRCDAGSGKYSLEFQQRDNESTLTSLKAAFHFRSDNILDYSTDTWTHLVFAKDIAVYNSTTGTIDMPYWIWVNGSLIDSGTTSVTATSISDFVFSTGEPTQLSTPRDDLYYTGDISVIRVYDYALEQGHIDELYNAGVESDTTSQCRGVVDFDYNNDCIVSIEDLSRLSEYWLSSGRVTNN